MSTDKGNLEPLDPEIGIDLYLDHKATDCTESTVQNHRYRLKPFLEWCDEQEITNLNSLSGRDIQEYRLWRSETGDINPLTFRMQMSTIRVFLKWAGSMEAVPENLYTKVMVPRVERDKRKRDVMLEAEDAKEILQFLSTYEYASVDHVLLALLWETGMRIGAAISIDLEDVKFDDQCIELVHRPDQGTTLKNGGSGERLVAMTDELSELLSDYIDIQRHNVTDDNGRKPLITTRYGRMRRSTMRRSIYRVTAPCYRDQPCPDCNVGEEAKCPESVSPHAIRRGSITHFLTKDVPVEVVSNRTNVSRKVLDEHYDRRSQEVKVEQRRKYLNNI
ncbi:site-specific integrase [Halobacteriaceae archaeon SHR40]|uniref:tyrosine-type recombinase/integrase n=1 Tax=Halovenus amylolytica TaxID=2500550 RepID=UPI000FE3464B